MDYKTLIRCFLEMKRDGAFANDVSELLIDEIITSPDFSDHERTSLVREVNKWCVGSVAEKADALSIIEKILKQKKQFKIEYASAIEYRLGGGRIEDF